jgi:predicted O-linked N-acetylglucosamine transferase (SPINDLY family)
VAVATRERADALAAAGRWSEAAVEYSALVAATPSDTELLTRLGIARFQQARYTDSARAFAAVTTLRPDGAGGHYNLARALAAAGDLERAGAAFEQCAALRPGEAAVYLAWAAALADGGRTRQALDVHERARAAGCTDPTLAYDHALLLERVGDARAAADRFEAAADGAAPSAMDARVRRAANLVAIGDLESALDALNAALATAPDHADARFQRGQVLLALGRAADADREFTTLLRTQPDLSAVRRRRGAARLALGHWDAAAADLAAAVAADDTDAEAWRELGDAHLRRRALLASAECYRRALAPERSVALDPESRAAALEGLAITLAGSGDLAGARDADARLLDEDPGRRGVAGAHLLGCLWIADWTDFADRRRRVLEAVVEGRTVASPFTLLALTDDPGVQQQAARAWTSSLALRSPRGAPSPRADGGRIRVGYLSPDFREHPVGHLMSAILERHDRSRFEVCALSIEHRPTDSAVRSRVRSAVERFVDLGDLDDTAAAERLGEIGIDVLVDLAGHTQGGRPGILVNSPAPVHVQFLGYPGTYGSHLMDYLIVDAFAAPAALEPFCDEALLRLPNSMLPPAVEPAVAPLPATRSQHGLPEDGLVVCAFHATCKILPETFATWMAVLEACPAAVLWLSAASDEAVRNLRRAASAHGVAPQRLCFARRVADPAAHRARLALADLFLDAFPYNAHSSAVDVLRAGVPVVTRAGQSLASRICGGFLHALGLPELVTHDADEYRDTAVQLLGNHAARATLHHWLQDSAPTKNVFDPGVYTINLEAALARAARGPSRADSPLS